MTPEAMEYLDGWHDCRNYCGEDMERSRKSPPYRQGFDDCLRSYYDRGWKGAPNVPAVPPEYQD